MISLCPCCCGQTKVRVRVQYRGSRGCRDELRECPECQGSGRMDSENAKAWIAKYGGADPVKP